MKDQFFTYYENQEEQKKLFQMLQADGFRNFDGLCLEKGHEKYAVIVRAASKGFSYVQPFIGAAAVSSGTRFYTVDEIEFLLKTGFKDDLPRIIFHVPHDGNEFPEELMKSVCIPEEDFMRYHRIMTDREVSRLVPAPFHYHRTMVRFPISRLLCDVERFTSDDEPMEKYGMGFCYSKAYDGTVIKTVTEDLKKKTLEYYHEHHRELNETLWLRSDHALLIDLHSFSEEIVPKDYITDEPLPDICIGTDPVYTPKHLAESAKRLFSDAGYSVAENYPYSGCMIPEAVYSEAESRRFAGIMVEMNRKVYLDQDGAVIEAEAGKIRRILKELVSEYEQTESGMKGNPNSSQA